jgi:zinc protease
MLGRLPFAAAIVLAALAAPLTAAQAPPPGAPSPAAARLSAPYTMFTLPNGLTVVLHEDHSVPQVAVNVWYHVGSSFEKPGRTGFAHLFEHLLFEGSKNVKEGEFDRLLESAGGNNNGSTTEDRTNYYETLPSNSLDLALYLESDRMGYLLDVVTPELVNGQRDVVKNERRQSYENAPYGKAMLRMSELLFPANHPYHWPVIGYMDDLTAATHTDVTEFFKKYYGPNNATLVIAGDINAADARKRVEYWFSDVKPGAHVEPIQAPNVEISKTVIERMTDQVQLPRLYLSWLTPGILHPGDAELDVLGGLLSSGKNSRLYKRLVYDMKIAQDVSAAQYSSQLVSTFMIQVTARPSQEDPDALLGRIMGVVDEELNKLRNAPVDDREIARVKNGIETSFAGSMETVASKADRMNAYYAYTGNPDYFAEDLGRYQMLQPNDIQAAVKRWLPRDRRVELSVVPAAK